VAHTLKFFSFLVVAFLWGCAPGFRTTSPFDGIVTRADPQVLDLPIEVSNDHWLPMRIWVEWPGMSRFLGDVAPGTTATYQVPRELVRRFGPLRLHADPTGSIDEVLSAPLDLAHGSRVQWRLRKVLSNSRARVM